ncbi:hypothetical protein [Janibacter sp. G1551]|uniref:hypothetical protein n=1 Tax=Janibacter sp. G1551 TaxID=3420440 RepID=UPI003D055CF8
MPSSPPLTLSAWLRPADTDGNADATTDGVAVDAALAGLRTALAAAGLDPVVHVVGRDPVPDRPTTDAVLVAPVGATFAPGAVGRLLAELDQSGRRLVRVTTTGPSPMLCRSDLLANGAVTLADVLVDGPGLDARLAAAGELRQDGQWRHWLDGDVVGVRAGTLPAGWAEAVERRHSLTRTTLTRGRRVAGRIRRDLRLRRARRAAR